MITTDTKYPFDPSILTAEDRARWLAFTGGREADLVIAPDGNPYLYRWNLTPKDDSLGGQVYMHVQIASDPERPLHDHPWDNMSVILAGGYNEIISKNPASPVYDVQIVERNKGDVIFRAAEEAHRLVLPKDHPYTMTLFSCGRVRREWGFWVDKSKGSVDANRHWKWVPSRELIEARQGNVSVQNGAVA